MNTDSIEFLTKREEYIAKLGTLLGPYTELIPLTFYYKLNPLRTALRKSFGAVERNFA